MKRSIFSILLALAIIVPATGYAQVTYVVYAVGNNGTILQLDGGQWLTVDPGDLTNCGDMLQIWGSASNDIYVTGCYLGDLLHYDGAEWQRITIPDGTPGMYDRFVTVNGTGPDDIYVGGGEYDGMYFYGVVYHYNGSNWDYIGGNGWTDKLWPDPSGDIYAICTKYDYSQIGDPPYKLVSHYHEGQWSTDWVADDEYGETFFDIAGPASGFPFLTGKLYDIWISTGSVIARKATDWTLLWYGVGCHDVYMNACPHWPNYYYGIWCESDNDVWFCGENGSVMHWTPTGYTEYDTGITQALRSIWGSTSSDIYAVGDLGTIVHFNGSEWNSMNAPTTENLRDIWGLFELPVATLLQSFSTDVQASHVTIRWSLSEIEQGADLRVSRITDAAAVYVIDESSDIDRDGLSFTYTDEEVEPGREYSYLVEYSSGDGWSTLIETDRIGIPFAPLALMPNYPNPFNPSTRITYSVPETGHVSLSVYDVSGRLVRTLVDEMQGPGIYVEHWNGTNDHGRPVASGTYFCRLVTAKRAETRKMLLTR